MEAIWKYSTKIHLLRRKLGALVSVMLYRQSAKQFNCAKICLLRNKRKENSLMIAWMHIT